MNVKPRIIYYFILTIFFFFRETFKIEVDVNATNLAYRSTYLQLHTDLPYYEYAPGVIFVYLQFVIITPLVLTVQLSFLVYGYNF